MHQWCARETVGLRLIKRKAHVLVEESMAEVCDPLWHVIGDRIHQALIVDQDSLHLCGNAAVHGIGVAAAHVLIHLQ